MIASLQYLTDTPEKRLEMSKTESRGFETSRDLVARRPSAWRIKALNTLKLLGYHLYLAGSLYNCDDFSVPMMQVVRILPEVVLSQCILRTFIRKIHILLISN